MVGDGKWLSVGEAAEKFLQAGKPTSLTTVRTYLTRGWLRGWYTGGNHARIAADSVDELLLVLRMKPGPERRAELEDLARKNGEG